MNDQYIELLKRISQTVTDMKREIDTILGTIPPVPKQITMIERGETSNSRSPMWRCTTADGERVNVFKHEDPEKNNFELFVNAGYGTVLLELELGVLHTWYNFPIEVQMRKVGKWWEIVGVDEPLVGVLPDQYQDDGDEDEVPTDRTALNNLRSALDDADGE